MPACLCARKICCFLLFGGWPFSGAAVLATIPSSGTNGGKNEKVPKMFLWRLFIELYEFVFSILTTAGSGLKLSLLGVPS